MSSGGSPAKADLPQAARKVRTRTSPGRTRAGRPRSARGNGIALGQGASGGRASDESRVHELPGYFLG